MRYWLAVLALLACFQCAFLQFQAPCDASGGCNVGQYPDKKTSRCVACPVGTTTLGCAATSVKSCSVCAQGYTGVANGKPGSCVACSKRFKGPITTPMAGNRQPCVCPPGHTGQPGNCRPCVGYNVTTDFPGGQVCKCPVPGDKPPFCRPCANGRLLNGRCVCPAGLTGVWPNCVECKASPLGFQKGTMLPGNNQRCDCVMYTGIDTGDDEPADYVSVDPATGNCRCRAEEGLYRKAPGPSDGCLALAARGFTAAEVGATIVTINKEKRIGCDARRGYGMNIGSSSPFCVKCSGPGTYLDPLTKWCTCKAGFAVNSQAYLIGRNDPDVEPTFRSSYCVPCTGPSLKAAPIPRVKGQQSCRCNWEAGYGGSTKCAQCKAGEVVSILWNGVESWGGICDVPPYCNDKTKNATQCLAPIVCKEGEVWNEDKCECRWFQSGAQCVWPKPGCEGVGLSYWENAPSADGKFPASVMVKTPTKSSVLTVDQVNSTVNLLDLVGPGVTKTNLAVVLTGCFCSREHQATTVVEVKSAGSASLQTFEKPLVNGDYGVDAGDPIWKTTIDQSTPHAAQQTGYHGVDHSWNGFYNYVWQMWRPGQETDLCVQFELKFYSGTTVGPSLSLRAVNFPFVKYDKPM